MLMKQVKEHILANHQNNNTALRYLQVVSTTFKPMGLSKGAAQEACKKYFALVDHFGLPSIFLLSHPVMNVPFVLVFLKLTQRTYKITTKMTT